MSQYDRALFKIEPNLHNLSEVLLQGFEGAWIRRWCVSRVTLGGNIGRICFHDILKSFRQEEVEQSILHLKVYDSNQTTSQVKWNSRQIDTFTLSLKDFDI